MKDGATSDHPAVQAQLDRLAALSLPHGRLSLEPTKALLARLGAPQRRLPPVFHVAGTNGKGSTCAFLRAALEAAGYRVHVYTSPHLVRFNERIRIAGRLIDDDCLADLLGEVLDAAGDLAVSFFEATTAAAILAFVRTPADACVIEVGLGGRLDATNVIASPAVCGIASLGIDHEAFLLAPEPGAPPDPLARIAWEKAGIAKPGVPLVTLAYPPAAAAAVAQVAASVGAPLFPAACRWRFEVAAEALRYRDHAAVPLPLPRLAGPHQVANYALAVAMLRHQQALAVPLAALEAAASAARWPGRLQRLGPGPLTSCVPGRAVWLDGGHNPDAGQAIAGHFAATGSRLHLVVGMLASKDPRAVMAPLAPWLLSVTAVPVAGHDSHRPASFAAVAEEFGLGFRRADSVADALTALADEPGDVLIAGSLYLAGEVLSANRELPD